MKRGRLLKPVLGVTAGCTILSAIELPLWGFAARWPLFIQFFFFFRVFFSRGGSLFFLLIRPFFLLGPS